MIALTPIDADGEHRGDCRFQCGRHGPTSAERLLASPEPWRSTRYATALRQGYRKARVCRSLRVRR